MNLRCDCISCKYEKQKSTEDPCCRCYNDSEYVYGGEEYNNFPQSRDKEGGQDDADRGESMRKTYCDHCGKEIAGSDINELSTDDCFLDTDNQHFVGCGYTLCVECWDERYNAHIQLDKVFLNIEELPEEEA